MASIIIPSSKSITITNSSPNENMNKDTILVGNDGTTNYFSYLFFDLSKVPCDTTIYHAELILFKTNNFYNDLSKVFGIYPCTYFSTYTTFINKPQIDGTAPIYFHPITSQVFTKAELTYIVSAWLKDPRRSTCIMLFSKSDGIIASFGSATSNDKYLIPFLKVSFGKTPKRRAIIEKTTPITPPATDNSNPYLEQVNVKGTVSANAKYNALINVAVKRASSGNTDNYYVVDEYDNKGNNKPLSIDKTYNITINPKLDSEDKDHIIFGGSYSD